MILTTHGAKSLASAAHNRCESGKGSQVHAAQFRSNITAALSYTSASAQVRLLLLAAHHTGRSSVTRTINCTPQQSDCNVLHPACTFWLSVTPTMQANLQRLTRARSRGPSPTSPAFFSRMFQHAPLCRPSTLLGCLQELVTSVPSKVNQ